MRDKFSIPHMEIAKAIRLAKQRMFKAHRDGMPLSAARDAFIADVDDVISEQDFQLRGNPPKHERVKQAEAQLADNDGTVNVETLRKRAQAIIANPQTKTGHRYHVEEFLQAEKWDDLAVIVDGIETGQDYKYDHILIANDDRTLLEDDVEAICKILAEHLESEHLAGYLFLLLDHIAAASRNALDAENAVYTMRRHFLAHNAHGADAAADHLKTTALANLRSKGVDNG